MPTPDSIEKTTEIPATGLLPVNTGDKAVPSSSGPDLATATGSDLLKHILESEEPEKSLLLDPVNRDALQRFSSLEPMARVLALSAARELDGIFRQKTIPILTSLVVYVLGVLTVSGNYINPWVASIISGIFALIIVLVVGYMGRKDAHKESQHTAWIKAFESI